MEKAQLLAVMEAYSKVHDFTAIVPISAKRREGLEELLDLLATFLPEGPQLFPRDAVTDQPERQICGDCPGKAAVLPGQRDPPRHGGGGHQVLRAGQRDH